MIPRLNSYFESANEIRAQHHGLPPGADKGQRLVNIAKYTGHTAYTVLPINPVYSVAYQLGQYSNAGFVICPFYT